MLHLAAVAHWDADAVILGAGAAKLTFWPDLRVGAVEVSAPSRKAAAPGYLISRRRIDPDLVTDRPGLRCTIPALTALDLTVTHGGDPIDTVLRTRQATLPELRRVFSATGNRRGNLDRRQLLLDSRGEPWSFAERRAHRLLREAGISGWRANFPLRLPGLTYFLDIAFEALRLALEIDGRTYHGPDTFDRERLRQNDIVLDGWRVLRFSADLVIDHGHLFVGSVERAIAQS